MGLAFALAMPARAAELAVPPDRSELLAALDVRLQHHRQQRLEQTFSAHQATAATGTTTRFYLGSRLNTQRLETLSLSIDDQPIEIAALLPEDAAPMATRRGLVRLATLELAPGPHRLHAVFTSRSTDEKAATTVPAEFDAAFEIGEEGGDWELVLQQARPLAAPTLALTEWRIAVAPRSLLARLSDPFTSSRAPKQAAYQPGSRFDPRWRVARQMQLRGRPFSAAIELLALEAAVGSAPDSAALLARVLLRYGTPEPALLALEGSRDAFKDLRAEALLALAEFHWQHRAPAEVLKALEGFPASGYEPLRLRAELLRGLAQIAERQFDAAAVTLAAIQTDPQRLLTASNDERLQAGLLQYNLGVALIAAGQTERGLGLLDRLGRSKAEDKLTIALRDKANVALGWQFLRQAQGATARPIFERVALEGPYSNRALLGLGWAALAPQGKRQARYLDATDRIEERDTPKFVLKAMQRRQLINCEEYNRRAVAPTELCESRQSFEKAEIPFEPRQLAEAALIPWLELEGRDRYDAAVRESWGAIPYALSRLGARAEAERYYESAIERLSAAIAETEAASRRLADHSAIELSSLAIAESSSEEPSLQASIAPFTQQLAADGLDHLLDSADLPRLLGDLLDVRWLEAGATEPDPELAALSEVLLEAINALAQDQLEAERQTLLKYLEAARAGLAGLNDPALAPLEP